MIIRLDSGAARNQLQTIGAVLDHPEDMLAESATRVERKLRGHFAERDKTANKLGGQRTHYWAQIANSTAVAEVTDRSASVDIGDGRFAQTLHGGEIRAKTPWPGSGFLLLTIPVHPAAHGRRVSVTARETGLKMTFVGSARGGVIGHLAAKAWEDEVYYVAVPSVIQEPDPNAMPPGDELEKEAIQGAQDYLDIQVQITQQQKQSNEPTA